jgi:hypothetical protein
VARGDHGRTDPREQEHRRRGDLDEVRDLIELDRALAPRVRRL